MFFLPLPQLLLVSLASDVMEQPLVNSVHLPGVCLLQAFPPQTYSPGGTQWEKENALVLRRHCSATARTQVCYKALS